MSLCYDAARVRLRFARRLARDRPRDDPFRPARDFAGLRASRGATGSCASRAAGRARSSRSRASRCGSCTRSGSAGGRELRGRGQPRELLRHPGAPRDLPMQVRFLAKRSIFRVPVLGLVDRGRRLRAGRPGRPRARRRRPSRRRSKRLRAGGSLVIFPEETRTRTVSSCRSRRARRSLALRSGLPAPARRASPGTFRVLRARRASRSRPGRVVLSVGRADRGRRPLDAASAARVTRAAARARSRRCATRRGRAVA